MPSEPARLSIASLEAFSAAAMRRLGVGKDDARCFARGLVVADARGVDSHGIARLPAYARKIEDGLLDPTARPSVIAEAPATALVDAGNGLGHVAAEFSMRVAIDKAREAGVGWISTIHSNHYGMAGYYAEMAVEHGMIGLSATNTGPIVAPTYGRTPMLGTNPIAVAAPTASGPPFLMDMATSAASGGKFQVAVRAGKEVPAGWGIDAEGRDVTDPKEITAHGSLLPLGSFPDLSSHKGYGLAMIVEVLTAMLGGGAFGLDVTALTNPRGQRPAEVSHMFAAIDLRRFGDLDRFMARMDTWLDALRSSPKVDGEPRIYIPGEKEWEAERRNRAQGVELPPPVMASLEALAARLGLAFPPDAAAGQRGLPRVAAERRPGGPRPGRPQPHEEARP